jgi:DNA-binding transcriptional LysR family regulator
MSDDAAPSWDQFAAFLAVMESGSLSGAARALRVAQPTVRRQIEALEQGLDVVLFTRAVNGLVPTEIATATLPYAQSIAASARAFVRSVSGATGAARGTVRVACSEVVGVEVIPAMLAQLARAEPEIQIELVVSNRNEDLVRRDVDLAIRMARPTQVGLVARRVGTIDVGLFAAEHYLAAHPAPRTLAALRGHALIGGDRDRSTLDAFGAHGLAVQPRDFVLRTDNQAAQLAAVRAGVGIGPVQLGIARREPALVRVVPKLVFPLDTWLVIHEDLRAVKRIRRVLDHLFDGLVAYAQGQAVGFGPR